jgi:hypothetical protein
MVNFGLNSASLLGIFLAVAGASLYFLRTVRPELSRDHDIFFAAVGLLCGFILLFQGWRLDPILQFGQFLLTGSAIFFAVESIRLRGLATEQARRNTPIVDRERPVSRSRVYTEAELDRIEPDEYERTPDYDSPRLRGYEEPPSRPSRGMREEASTFRSRSRSEQYNPSEPDNYRRRSNKPPRGDRYNNRYDDWEKPEKPERRPERKEEPSYRNPPRSYSEDIRQDNATRPSRAKKPDLTELGRTYDDDEPEVISTDYVDYQPIDEIERNKQNDDWEDTRNRSSQRERKPRPRQQEDRGNPINFDY